LFFFHKNYGTALAALIKITGRHLADAVFLVLFYLLKSYPVGPRRIEAASHYRQTIYRSKSFVKPELIKPKSGKGRRLCMPTCTGYQQLFILLKPGFKYLTLVFLGFRYIV